MPGLASAIRAGLAYIEIGLKTDALEKGLKAAESQLKGFGIAVTQIGAAAGAAGAAITVPLLAMAKTFAEGTSSLQHMSERTGISIEALSALGYAAKQTGIDLDTVEGAVRKMQKAMTAGSLENQQAAQTFANLGLNVKKLEQLKPEEAFEILANRIAAIPNENARAGAAMLVFGKTGTSILPLIENMAALTKEAKDFGLVASTKGVEAGTRLQHAFNLLDKSISFTQGTIASALAPTLTEMNAAFARNLKTVREWISANKPLVLQAFQIGLALTAVGTAFATLGAAFVVSGAVLGGVATTLAAVGAALGLLLSPISLVIAGLGGLAAWFVTSTNAGGKSLQWLGERFGDLKTTAVGAFKGIADALKAGDIKLAADILLAEINVVWLKGLNQIGANTNDLLSAIQVRFHNTSLSIAKDIQDAMAGIKDAIAGAKAAITLGSTAFKSIQQLNDLAAGRAKARDALVAGLRSGNLTPEQFQKAIKVMEDEIASEKARILRGGGKEAVGAIGGFKEEVVGNAAEAIAGNKAIEDQRAADAKARDAAGKKLTDAEKSLADLLKKAKEGAGKLGPLAEEGKSLGEQPEFTPKELDKSIASTARKTLDTKGSFSAQAVRGFGSEEPINITMREVLKENRQTNKHLTDINKKVAEGQQVFGR